MREPSVIVCGSGSSLWEDLRSLDPLPAETQLMGVNLTGLFLPRAHHLVSLHPEIPGLVRTLRGFYDLCPEDLEHPPATHGRRAHDGIDHVWPLSPHGRQGTSSLFAVWVALQHLGASSVILAGVPLDGAARHFDPPGTTGWRPYAGQLAADQLARDRLPWETAAREWFADRVRSCSGWTADLLGSPEPALAEEAA